jgi:hypothetical protein
LTTRRGGSNEQVEHDLRQQEWAEVVDGEGRLKTVDGQLAAPGRRAGVVDQHVDAAEACVQLGREHADRVLAGKVGGQKDRFRAGGNAGHLVAGSRAACRILGDHDQSGAVCRQLPRGGEADAAARPGDDDCLVAHTARTSDGCRK